MLSLAICSTRSRRYTLSMPATSPVILWSMCARMGLPTLSSAITLPLLGYKYFNFTSTFGRRNLKLVLNLIPEGVDGTITVMADRPWASQGGIVLGSLELKADMSDSPADFVVDVPARAACPTVVIRNNKYWRSRSNF